MVSAQLGMWAWGGGVRAVGAVSILVALTPPWELTSPSGDSGYKGRPGVQPGAPSLSVGRRARQDRHREPASSEASAPTRFATQEAYNGEETLNPASV